MWNRRVATYLLCAYSLLILVGALPQSVGVDPLYKALRAVGFSPGESPFTENYPAGYNIRARCLRLMEKTQGQEFLVYNTPGCPRETAIPYTDPFHLSMSRILSEADELEAKETVLRDFFCKKLPPQAELHFTYSRYVEEETVVSEKIMHNSVRPCEVKTP